MPTTIQSTSFSDIASLTKEMKQVRNANFRGCLQHTDVFVPINDLRNGGAELPANNVKIICLSEMKWGDSIKSLKFATPIELTALSFGVSVFPLKDRNFTSEIVQYSNLSAGAYPLIINEAVVNGAVRTGLTGGLPRTQAKTNAGVLVPDVFTEVTATAGQFSELITFDKTHKTLHELLVDKINALAVADKETAEEIYYKYRNHPCMLCLVMSAITTIAANNASVLFSIDYIEQSPSGALNDTLTPRNSL